MDFLNTEDETKFVKWQRIFNYALCVNFFYIISFYHLFQVFVDLIGILLLECFHYVF